jgi:hypothetical protein
LSAAPGGVIAATPRLIASMAEGEFTELVRLPKDSGGEKSFGVGGSPAEQPAKKRSEIRNSRVWRDAIKGKLDYPWPKS